MKKLISYAEKCTGCGACEEICSRTYFKTADRSKSAIRVTKDGDSYIVEVCDQCGDCIKMCSPRAVLRAKNGVVRITGDKCVGCLICVSECLRGFMHYHDAEPIPFKCVACGICVKQCEAGALSLTD